MKFFDSSIDYSNYLLNDHCLGYFWQKEKLNSSKSLSILSQKGSESTMSPEYRNIYQIAREGAGITQEKASELIDISVESIRAYESGRRIPPGNVVIRMVDIYDARYLAYQHLKAEEVGQKYLPTVEVRGLPSAILRLQKEVLDFLKSRDELIEISCDGSISAIERPEYDRILKELDDIVAAIMSLKCAKTG